MVLSIYSGTFIARDIVCMVIVEFENWFEYLWKIVIWSGSLFFWQASNLPKTWNKGSIGKSKFTALILLSSVSFVLLWLLIKNVTTEFIYKKMPISLTASINVYWLLYIFLLLIKLFRVFRHVSSQRILLLFISVMHYFF